MSQNEFVFTNIIVRIYHRISLECTYLAIQAALIVLQSQCVFTKFYYEYLPQNIIRVSYVNTYSMSLPHDLGGVTKSSLESTY